MYNTTKGSFSFFLLFGISVLILIMLFRSAYNLCDEQSHVKPCFEGFGPCDKLRECFKNIFEKNEGLKPRPWFFLILIATVMFFILHEFMCVFASNANLIDQQQQLNLWLYKLDTLNAFKNQKEFSNHF